MQVVAFANDEAETVQRQDACTGTRGRDILHVGEAEGRDVSQRMAGLWYVFTVAFDPATMKT